MRSFYRYDYSYTLKWNLFLIIIYFGSLSVPSFLMGKVINLMKMIRRFILWLIFRKLSKNIKFSVFAVDTCFIRYMVNVW